MSMLLTILGPTACGKTRLACDVARAVGGEIISGDSRQVYRGMDIGTGKDLADYGTGASAVPYHLIDIHPAGYHYTVFEFQHDFLRAYEDITSRQRQPILCGGSGLYIESVVRAYRLSPVPQNPELRQKLIGKSLEELTEILASYKTLHNTTDVDLPARAIRAIEIADYNARHPLPDRPFPVIPNIIVGIDVPREIRRERISKRLDARLREGLIEEIQALLQSGLTEEQLTYYGLEYKFVTEHVCGHTTYNEMRNRLEIAIHQFAKRQMTYFRGMERRGVNIHWIDGTLAPKEQTEQVLVLLHH
ncbi:MAG: tRNA (adenosine(37)-N6)-dimethylallyltransferase MiaA [Bacteroidaceae bacterium]|nr:tRNA (adenosine(37)-N6)-dimethylallyltransferase MiaA [Bacteroidaceae bacterium]MBR7028503.1 tRNA (adenosine(37)-N6)-dimethylallyltransferase MiaA [Bacteroidaceae bacterium]